VKVEEKNTTNLKFLFFQYAHEGGNMLFEKKSPDSTFSRLVFFGVASKLVGRAFLPSSLFAILLDVDPMRLTSGETEGLL
jgi:hypothetical protein